MFGDQCCTYVPNNTAADGSFTKAMTQIRDLRENLARNAGFGHEATTWLESLLGGWGAFFAKIGIAILAFLTVLALVLCCCIPILRGLISKGISRAMNIQALQMTIMKNRDNERDSRSDSDLERHLSFQQELGNLYKDEKDY